MYLHLHRYNFCQHVKRNTHEVLVNADFKNLYCIDKMFIAYLQSYTTAIAPLNLLFIPNIDTFQFDDIDSD